MVLLHCKRVWQFLTKLNILLPKSQILTQRSWKHIFTQNLHVDVYSSFIQNCQNVEITKMSFSKWRHIQVKGYFIALKGNELSGFPGGSVVENLPANAGDMGSMPGSVRSPGEGNGNPFQYSCLGNPMNRGAWRATVPGVKNSWTWPSNRITTKWINLILSKSLFQLPLAMGQ